MKELWEIKKQISKELYGKSWEEVDKFFKEASRKFRELDKDPDNEKIPKQYSSGETISFEKNKLKKV